MTTFTLSEFKGDTGEIKIYSSYGGMRNALLFETTLKVEKGDFAFYRKIEKAIREAEKIAYQRGKEFVKDSIVNLLERES